MQTNALSKSGFVSIFLVIYFYNTFYIYINFYYIFLSIFK